MSRIPITAAEKVAKQYGLSQCIILGWDGELAHVTTYGKTKEDCAMAAQAQGFWTGKIKEFSFTMKWVPVEDKHKTGANIYWVKYQYGVVAARYGTRLQHMSGRTEGWWGIKDGSLLEGVSMCCDYLSPPPPPES